MPCIEVHEAEAGRNLQALGGKIPFDPNIIHNNDKETRNAFQALCDTFRAFFILRGAFLI